VIHQATVELRQKLRELAMARRRFGYRRLHALLRREGSPARSSAAIHSRRS